MPLAVRYVQPKSLCRHPLPRGVKSELHAVAVYSVAAAIRQVSSLALQAESVLGELVDTMAAYQKRMELLGERARRIKEDVLPGRDLDWEADHLFRSPLPTRHFKSNDTIDQQVLSIATSPPSLAEQYYAAEPKPALHVFDELWPDKRHALSLYSNPCFFFENWRRNMEREARRMRASRTSSVGEDSGHEMTTKAVVKYDSSTLPTRGKKKRQSIPTSKNAFNSVRGVIDKKRPGLTDDLFITHEEQSESSGYTSQQSSYNSLTEQDGAVNGTHAYTNGSTHWTNGPPSLAQWSATQPSHDSMNGGPPVFQRGRVQSMVESFSKRGSVYKPEYGYETDISAHRMKRAYSSSHNTGDGLEESERERRKIPPVKLIKPKRSRESAMDRFSAGGRSVSMSCVATGLDGPQHQDHTHSAQGRTGTDRAQRPLSFAVITGESSIIDDEEDVIMSKLLPPSPGVQTTSTHYPTNEVAPTHTHDYKSTNSQPPPLSGNTQSSQVSYRNSGGQFNSSPKHRRPLTHRASAGDLPFYAPRSPSSPKFNYLTNVSFPEESWPPQQQQHGRKGSSSSSSSSSTSPSIQMRRRTMSHSSSVEDGGGPSRKAGLGKLFRPSSGDKTKHRKQPSIDADLPPTKDRDARPRKNSQQILVASGVNAELTMQRSQLLTSIRKGIQLKKVQHEVQMKERMAAMPWDVAAILERRHAIEMSDNEVEEGVVLDAEWEESQ